VALSDSLDLEAIAARKGPRCTVCSVREDMTAEDRDALDAALANKTIPSSVIGRALRREGHSIAESTVRRHRSKECRG
jgi:hypothetical protein